MPGRKIEILAPAGSYDAFKAAIRAGADAVYAGGTRFGARAYADNFSEKELIKAIKEAHFYGRKIYLTVNTLLKEHEIDTLWDYLRPYYENGLDAVIVQDFGVVEYIRNFFPDLDIHASTQMTITDVMGAKFVQDQGMTRVVPARELSLDEIRQIRQQTNLEIECFVHGALCYCYSGQCLLSSMIGGRSGNRGQCAQPCRLPYTFENASEKGRQYYLSAKDICTLDLIPDLIDAGIDSFKIEGRMKSPQYVAGVTAMYRKYTDLYLASGRNGFSVSNKDREILMDLFNRGGFSTGYFNHRNGSKMLSLSRPNHAGVPAARVQYQKGREVKVRALTGLHAGDVLEIPGEKNSYTLGDEVQKGEQFSFLLRKQVRLPSGMTLRRIKNKTLIEMITDEFIEQEIKRPVNGVLTMEIGKPAVLRVTSGEFTCEAESDEPVQTAVNKPLTEMRVTAQIRKTGNTPFVFSELSVQMDNHVFIPVQQLSALRRKVLDRLETRIMDAHVRNTLIQPYHNYTADIVNHDINSKRSPLFSLYIETEDQLATASDFFRRKKRIPEILYLSSSILTSEYFNEERINTELTVFRNNGTEIYVALPHVLRSSEYETFRYLLETADKLNNEGVLVRSCGEFQFLKESGFDKKIILDHNLYVYNHYAKIFWERLGVSDLTAPLELNVSDLLQTGVARELEFEIYGAQPVMVSAQCLFKTSGRCSKNSDLSELTDRFGNQFPVRACCDFCYNVIYNKCPQFMQADNPSVRELKPSSLRIRFSTEIPETVKKVLDAYF